MMTYKAMIDYGKARLLECGIADYSFDAWLLFQYVTDVSRAMYLMEPEREADSEAVDRYKACIEKRAEHYPLQYITHSQEFMGLDFYVDERVLVPRQDTEVLVETVLEYLEDDMEIMDMCTGSGCILISLAANKNLQFGLGVDLSEGALAVAGMNAQNNGCSDLNFLQSNLFEKLEGMKFDIIVSNPPYIQSDVIPTLMPEVREHEPMMALDGEADGLYFYRRITEQASQFLKQNGMVFFEIGWDQGEAVKDLMEAAGFHDVIVKKDLAGLDRVVYGILG